MKPLKTILALGWALLFTSQVNGQAQGSDLKPVELQTARGNRVWVYLPKRGLTNTPLACVLIPPAGSPLFHGIRLSDEDRAEHLPYVAAGFAVVSFDLSGPMAKTDNQKRIREAVQAFSDAGYGVRDALEALALAQARYPALDGKRIYVAGHSSAGTLALQLAAASKRVRACIAFAPVCDVEQRLGAELLSELDRLVPGMRAGLRNWSPRCQVARFTCPLYLFHALDDENVFPAEIVAFRTALAGQGINVEYVAVNSGGHYDSMIQQGIPGAVQWLKRMDRQQAP